MRVAQSLCVANIIGQSDGRLNYPPPIRYKAIREALERVRQLTLKLHASTHMLRMGAGLVGGNWQLITGIIESELAPMAFRPPFTTCHRIQTGLQFADFDFILDRGE